MFKALLFKEWREKASVAAFGLGLMAAFLAAFLALGDKRDMSDLVTAGFLLLVFPFLGLLLGASAFETEFRDHAWAYLLSRPVRKETAWLAKLVALLAFLAGLWVVFLAMMKAVPALANVAMGYKLPAGLQVDISFFPLAVLSSFYYFAIAFSLSILSERQFSLVFASLFTGFMLQALLYFLAFRVAGERIMLSLMYSPAWLEAYRLALVLSALAFLGASILTFRKTDFSQPRKKCRVFARFSVGFLALAWLLAAAWPLIRPASGADRLSGGEVIGDDQAYFSTGKGIYRYDAATDGLERLSTRPHTYFEKTSVRAGKIVYEDMVTRDLRMMNTDGSGNRLLFRPVTEGTASDPMLPVSFLLSPDGKTVVFFASHPSARSGRRGHYSLWSVGTDGSGLNKLPLDSALAGPGSWFDFLAWPESETRLLFRQTVPGDHGSGYKIWLYDLASGSARVLLDNAGIGYPLPSPRQDLVAVPYRSEARAIRGLCVLDPKTMETTDVLGGQDYTALRMNWTPRGDRLAILYGTAASGARLAVYSLTERRIIASRDLELEANGERWPGGLGVDWVGEDGQVLLSDSKAGVLRVLDKDLADEKRYTTPASAGSSFWVAAACRVVLLTDTQHNRLWRLDLKTEKWKIIW